MNNTKQIRKRARKISTEGLEKYTVFILNCPGVKNLKKSLNELTIVAKLTSDVTHLVVENEIVEVGNVAVLRAIVRQIPVVNFKCRFFFMSTLEYFLLFYAFLGLQTCAEQKCIVDYHPFLIKGTGKFQNVMPTVEEHRNQMVSKFNCKIKSDCKLSLFFGLC